MQNDALASCDEVEPRRTPKQALNFDTRPFPMVPEVSLVMDKTPQQQQQSQQQQHHQQQQQQQLQLSRQVSDPLSDTVPESRSFNRDLSHQASDTYSAWKEKRFPQHAAAAPSPIHKIYSSTQNASGLQDNHGYRQSFKSYNALDFKHFSSNNCNLDHELQRNRIDSQCNRPIEHSNKYISNYLNGNNHNHTLRSVNEENRTNLHNNRWSDERVWSNEINQDNDRRYLDDRKNLSNESKKPPGHSHQTIQAYDLINKLRQQRSSLYSNANSSTHKNSAMEYDRHSNQFHHSDGIPSQEHCNHQTVCCSTSHPNHNSSAETETVRNLLQVITSQNEQIKSLQKHLDRMIKLHEQSLKNRNQCTCQSNMNHNEMFYHQNSHPYDQSRNNNLPLVSNNVTRENERCISDLQLHDDRIKKTIVEQKVSIGVMTSFELKVQNNPSMVPDYESKQKASQEKVKPIIETSNMVKNLVNDTGEMIRRKHNHFTPTPLENISEGSESHMSSMRQSHLCSDSAKQSAVESHDFVEASNDKYSKKSPRDKEIESINLESSDNYNRYRENFRLTPTSDHAERKKPAMVEQKNNNNNKNNSNNNDNREMNYQYDFQFENVRSSPLENSPRADKLDDLSTEPLISDITKTKQTKCDNFVDECLSLSESELDIEDPSPASPEPSIHLDMQEFSSEGGSLPPQQATKVGWTLYNNVLDQVNQILQNSPSHDNRNQETSDDYRDAEKREQDNENFIMDTVKAATLEQLTKLGISFSDNADQRRPFGGNKRVMFDEPYYTRQGPLENQAAATASPNFETNTSMHMRALARKYLNEEQLAEIAVQKTQTGAIRQTSSVQNTNMSFATMHYLQRYHLLPGNNNSSPTQDVRGPVITERLAAVRAAERREPSPRRYQGYAGTSKVSFPSKILDISTLKQQPKLL